ncbi:YqgQ family protein [Brevibacillus dissolubilis]|uniref:YqgQ family protein n=1 Tax=Brevibacillus dissolubilis TaxID=1844116 RepID=UPI0011174483|nr:YqgQ family protein [Brevibacillus dissolubilis]
MLDKRPFDLTAFLKRFGIFIYTGDPEGDFLLIEDEIKELKLAGIIETEEYLQAMMALRKKYRKDVQ